MILALHNSRGQLRLFRELAVVRLPSSPYPLLYALLWLEQEKKRRHDGSCGYPGQNYAIRNA